jgi:DNA polymerase elongation subunit (family B)
MSSLTNSAAGVPATLPPLSFKMIDVRDNKDPNGMFLCFGRTGVKTDGDPYSGGKSVCVRMVGYSPNFFVKMPPNWTTTNIQSLYKLINERITKGRLLKVGDVVAMSRFVTNPEYSRYGTVRRITGENITVSLARDRSDRSDLSDNEVEVTRDTIELIGLYRSTGPTLLHDYTAFNGDNKEPFLRMAFTNSSYFSRAKYELTTPIRLPGIASVKLQTFEANIEPPIRCMHSNDITPCGWVTTSKYELLSEPQVADSATELPTDAVTDAESLESLFVRRTDATATDATATDATATDATDATDSATDSDSATESATDGRLKRISNCDIEIICRWNEMHPDKQKNNDCISAPFSVMSYDIECNSHVVTNFPDAQNVEDEIFQIACTFNIYQSRDCHRRYLLTTKPVTVSTLSRHTKVLCYSTERELLLGFVKLLRQEDPDVITGYFINGFDNKYMYDRAEMLRIKYEFNQWSRLLDTPCELKKWTPSSSGMGENIMYVPECYGRVIVDLNKVLTMNLLAIGSLSSYKLDNVAQVFYRGPIRRLRFEQDSKRLVFETANTELEKGSYIYIMQREILTNIEDPLMQSKFEIESTERVDDVTLRIYLKTPKVDIAELVSEIETKVSGYAVEWSLAKDDIEPVYIFRTFQQGTPDDAALIGKYCEKDAMLVNVLVEKMEVLGTTMELANVTRVPLYYIFNRGQGVKSYSLISYGCRQRSIAMPDMDKRGTNEEGKYNGAAVFDPLVGVHYEPVVVNDFSSLYPSEIIAMNMSRETHVQDTRYLNLPNYIYHKTGYDDNGVPKTEYFAQRIGTDGVPEFGTVPAMLMTLLESRKNTKKAMKTEKDDQKRRNLSGREKALKITANSIYGQLGAKTSDIYHRPIAACTTAGGQRRLFRARDFVLQDLTALWADIGKLEPMLAIIAKSAEQRSVDDLRQKVLDMHRRFDIDPELVYGDTDSGFFKYNVTSRPDNLADQANDDDPVEIRRRAMMMGMIVGDLTKSVFPSPHEFQYEKVFHPLICITKKRYTGNKYEDDPNKFKVESMGLVTKRRDNAKIVKVVMGNLIDMMLRGVSVYDILDYIKDMLSAIESNKFPISYYVTTKSIKDLRSYKDVNSLVHTRLAVRMIERDPNSAPQPNERLSYVYVLNKRFYSPKGSKLLQGDRVEELSYFKKNETSKNLKIDYIHYITNQIQSPVCQFLDLLIPNSETAVFKPIVDRMILDVQGIVPISNFFKKAA